MADAVPAEVGRWDGRWQVAGPSPAGARIGALGSGGLHQLGRHRDGVAREALAASPAVWCAGRLVAAPVASPEEGWTAWRVAAVAPPWRREIVR